MTWNSEHPEISMLFCWLGGGMPAIHSPAWDGGGVFARQSTAGVGGRGGASASTNSVEIFVARYQAQKKLQSTK